MREIISSAAHNIRCQVADLSDSMKLQHMMNFGAAIAALLLSLVVAYVAHVMISRAEDEHFDREYNAIANAVYHSLYGTLSSAQSTSSQVSTLYISHFPNSSQWPLVYLPEFYLLMKPIFEMASVSPFVAPILNSSQVSDFEMFALHSYRADPSVPPGTGESDFGFGIYAIDYCGSGGVYHDTVGDNCFGQPSMLTPVLQASNLPRTKAVHMKNIHSDPGRGEAMERAKSCVERQGKEIDARSSCVAITDLLLPTFLPDSPMNYISLLFEPIVSSDQAIVGFTGVPIPWVGNLINQAPKDLMSNILLTIATPKTSLSFSIHGGVGYSVSKSDLLRKHEKKFTFPFVSEATPHEEYTISIYPSKEFHNKRHTITPLVVSILIGVGIPLLLGLLYIYRSYIFMIRDTNANISVMRAKEMFVRVASHEVRSPLQCTKLVLEVLESIVDCLCQRTDDMSAKQAQELGAQLTDLYTELVLNTESAVTVLDDMLSLDVAQDMILHPHLRVIPFEPLVDECIAPYKRYISLDISRYRAPEIGREWEDAAGNLTVLADPVLLSKVINNLVLNSLKFSLSDSNIKLFISYLHESELCVTKDLSLQSGTCCTGPVMALTVRHTCVQQACEEDLLIPTSAFNDSSDQLRVGQGNSLGLWICKRIVDSHQGEMKIASVENSVTEVYIEIPLVRSEPQQLHILPTEACDEFVSAVPSCDEREFNPIDLVPSLPRVLLRMEELVVEDNDISMRSSDNMASIKEFSEIDESCATSPRRGTPTWKKVLIVDDIPSIRKLLTRALTTNGLEVECAANGQECVDIFSVADRANEFGCIIMDYEMPIMNGPTATKIVRSMGYNGSQLLILGLTGNTVEKDKEYFLSCGVETVLHKPARTSQLLEIFAKHRCMMSFQQMVETLR